MLVDTLYMLYEALISCTWKKFSCGKDVSAEEITSELLSREPARRESSICKARKTPCGPCPAIRHQVGGRMKSWYRCLACADTLTLLRSRFLLKCLNRPCQGPPVRQKVWPSPAKRNTPCLKNLKSQRLFQEFLANSRR